MAASLSDSQVLHHVAYHVFLPPQLPQRAASDDQEQQVALKLASTVIGAARQYVQTVPKSPGKRQWVNIIRMLQHVHDNIETPLRKDRLLLALSQMETNDVLALHIRAQNAAVIVRKQSDFTIFEVFEVQAPNASVMSTPGKLIRHYPGPAVKVPATTVGDVDFITELSNFLTQMDTEYFEEATPTTRKAGSNVEEDREMIDPSYFTQLFLGILRGMGEVFDPPRVVKRVADEVLWKDAAKPWRRSPIWLIIRVALQTSLESTLSYKHFMVYHHVYTLSLCRKRKDFSSELLFSMRAKMARRLYKVKDTAPAFVTAAASSAVKATQTVLQDRWGKIQTDQGTCPEWNPSVFDIQAATRQSLTKSRGYLEDIFKGRSSQQPRSTFIPKHLLRLENTNEFVRYTKGKLTLSKLFQADKHIALFDFEASVHKHLTSWTNANRSDATGACRIMTSCFQQYLVAARSYYIVDIADQSIMILTLMRIWMAIDQLATSQCPLMLDFSPEIPEDILESLLLHTSMHIEQARIIQQHLRSRHARASPSNPSIFSEQVTPQSFAVRYFQQSSRLRSLKSTIESNARAKRDEKVRELKRKNEEHARLTRQAEQLNHFHHESQKKQDRRRECERCRIEQTRKKLKIQLHEWPLPDRQFDAESVVFELERPEPFTIWRDTTYEILCDLGSAVRGGSCTPHLNLESYDGLKPWLSKLDGIPPRIMLASTTKPFTKAHYLNTKIPATEDRVCVNNGLQYKLYDKRDRSWATAPFSGVTVAKFGTLKLPLNSSYQHLYYALEGTKHSSNQVIAGQYGCPKDLSLHEHIAYGTLRSGARLQWMNIIRGLEENILTFSSEEVELLHTQAAWQMGSLRDDGSREWHHELNDPNFGELLISVSRRMLKRVEANWLEARVLSTIVLLVKRLLASSPTTHVAQCAYGFLREARDVSLKWMMELQSKLESAEIVADIVDYQSRVCEMAAICRSTFDVNPCHITNLLNKPEDFAAFIKCSIIMYDNQPPDLSNASTSLQTLLCRDRRLAHGAIGVILQALRQNTGLLCAPISEIWRHYRSGSSGWREITTPNNRWVWTTTAEGSKNASQNVHLNLLDGQLLVDGKPLGRLPREYVQHPTYLRLFGQKVLDVVPASSPGMTFATRGTVHGYEITFARVEASSELYVQAHKENRTFELVPYSQLSGDFPASLSSDYHHWADLEGQVVEFRPLEYPWSSSHRKWLLRFSQDGTARMEDLRNGSGLLIDIRNPLFHSFSRQFQPLESPDHLHVTRSSENQIQVVLPRMGLSFFLNKEMQLESHNFRGQVIDRNQSTGTMFGLRNQLVLRTKDPVTCTLPRSRSVLIPHGDVHFSKQDHHVSVTIDPGSDREVLFHRYLVDIDLGYLASDAGLTSRLFKIYLHALTSHCLPDPLTGCTGTEEALSELLEPATSSFEQINKDQAKLLGLIGSLTPKRGYYPTHLKCMQTTHWANLPFLSQHVAFHNVASKVLDNANTLQLFHPLDFKLEDFTQNLDSTLLKRASRQTYVYYPPTSFGTQIPESPKSKDQNYAGRDSWTSDWTDSGHIAAWTSGLAFRSWGKQLYKSYDLVSLLESAGTVEGMSEHLDLAYSSHWLNIELPASWIAVYNLCRQAKTTGNKYSLCFCLATAGFSQVMSTNLLAVLVALASSRAFHQLAPPTDSTFQLADGYQPVHERVKVLVSNHARRIKDSPAIRLRPQHNESEHDLERRQQSFYDEQIQKYKTEFVQALISQWPAARLTGSPIFSSWFRVEICLPEVQGYFLSCLRNIKLRDHLRAIETILSSQPASQGTSFSRAEITPAGPLPASEARSSLDIPNLIGLMCSRPCPDAEEVVFHTRINTYTKSGCPADTSRLSKLFDEFQQDPHPLNRRYGKDLDESRRDLASKSALALHSKLPSIQLLTTHSLCSQSQLHAVLQRLVSALGPLTDVESVLSQAGIWPRITPRTILKQLSLKVRSQVDPSSKWHGELIDYAQAFVNYQHYQRLVALAYLESKEEFYQELNFDPEACGAEINDPDWLLVQIDGNFSTRAVQRQVAQQMITPSSGTNTVLQLNMGEGKSSVIVPITAAALANTKQLVRIVVLKPLWRQMFHLLVNRLSGLAHRRIYYLPFGRHIQLDSAKAQQLQVMYNECMREGGIILAQPEHILSFKLMGIDYLISSSTKERMSTAQQLQGIQRWLTRHTRDILDESDEILHVRYQLVYTVGQQQPLEYHPDRWTTTQQILQHAASHIRQLQATYPESFMYEEGGQGQFPLIRVMPDCDDQIEQEFARQLAEDILAGRIPSLNCSRLALSARNEIIQFLTESELPAPNYQRLKNNSDPVMWKGLLLIRGLLASGILVFALKQKHYRVDYGLDLGRSLLAVPYRAKDIPSLRAEFGHPDVAIILTCLSYYYKGLTDDQLDHCFELLYKHDNPALEYEQWVARSDVIKPNLRHLNGVNIKDREQFRDHIVPTFSRNSAVVDFFLSSVVFPKAAQEFPHKLSTSGWDLAERKPHVTTGFSGTNDNRYLLPTSITQADPPDPHRFPG